MDTSFSEIDLIREAFYYKKRYEGSTMVFKIDYPVTGDPGFLYLMKDLSLLAQTGIKIVIVPGVKESIDAFLKEHAIISESCPSGNLQEPARITEDKAIPFVEMAAFNAAACYMTSFSRSRVDAVIGNFVRARSLGVVDGTDMGHTGTVDKIYVDSISRALELGMVPILPCIGWSPVGKPYNVPSDEIALAVSTALRAAKLFIVTGREHRQNVLPLLKTIETREDGSIIRLTPQETEQLIQFINDSNTDNAGRDLQQYLLKTLRELKLALRAARDGVDRVHIVDGRQEGAVLKELFSNLGSGTMVYTDEYESIRQIHGRDIPDILRLIEPFMQKGILVRRTAEQIQDKKNDYYVFEIDGSIHACGALHDLGEKKGEIAAVASNPVYTGMNLGRRIVEFLIEKARKNKMDKVFVLTTSAPDWFESLGFIEDTVNSLPLQRQELYDYKRNSKIYSLEIFIMEHL
ncbi:MAG: amino-acid N-acetyltransferase [Treponema sp.]|nr:amino-acid N-acetyltransferase [Treponema sp.]